MSVDTIGNFLTIIRNGVMVSTPTVSAFYSKMNSSIAQILKDEGFIKNFVIEEKENKKYIKVYLKYVDGESAIHEITRVSKPGRRLYEGYKVLKPVKGKLGISILTTNRGIISDKQAQKFEIGGEVICTVW